MINKKITSIADLINELKSCSNTHKPPIWYRGHSNSNWKLLPCYHRFKQPPPELQLLNQFRQNANLLVSNQPAHPHDFGWMFLMQHYGVPTRLLDWTESPLVALYFAVNDYEKEKKDGALWILYPARLNSYSSKSGEYIPSFDDMDWTSNYTLNQFTASKVSLLPLAAIAARNNSRIQAQLGVFTISHRDQKPIEEIEDGSHCLKLIIPARSKKIILDELAILGLSRFQIFPELATIGLNISERIK